MLQTRIKGRLSPLLPNKLLFPNKRNKGQGKETAIIFIATDLLVSADKVVEDLADYHMRIDSIHWPLSTDKVPRPAGLH